MLPSEAGELMSWERDAEFSHLDELDKWFKGKKKKLTRNYVKTQHHVRTKEKDSTGIA